MDLKVFDIMWKDDEGKPKQVICDFIDPDNSMDDITEIISEWLEHRYGAHDGFIWEFIDNLA